MKSLNKASLYHKSYSIKRRQRSNNPSYKQRQQPRPKWTIMDVLTLLLVLANTIVIGVMVMQYGSMSDQTEINADELRLNRLQTKALGQQLKLTREQIEIYKTTTEYDLRAYITLKDFGHIPNLCEPGNTFRVFANAVNVGKTPAFDVSIWQGIAFGTDDRAIDTLKSQSHQSNSKLVAGSNLPFPIMFDHLYQMADDIRMAVCQDRTAFIYFYSHIWYNDIFGKPHETEICSRLEIIGGAQVWRATEGKCYVD